MQESEVIARMQGSRIIVEKEKMSELIQSGFGKKTDQGLVLEYYEAMYLLYTGKIKVVDEKEKSLSFDSLSEIAQRNDRNAWTKFIIYRDLRSRGYLVREGFGFGTDLRVYQKGQDEKAAKYVVFALDEGVEKKISELERDVREIIRMGKEPIIAVLERRGEVIYYKVSIPQFKKEEK